MFACSKFTIDISSNLVVDGQTLATEGVIMANGNPLS